MLMVLDRSAWGIGMLDEREDCQKISAEE